MDTTKFIDMLNDDLATEYQSIVQYIQHIAVITGAEYLSTVDELRAHVSQEVTHAMTLAEQVSFLGGVPTVSLTEPAPAAEAREALREDLALETRQLERYRE